MSSKHTNVTEILAEYRAERLAVGQALRHKLADERQLLAQDVATMRRTWQAENAQSAAQTRAELAAFRAGLAQDVAALRRAQQENQQEMGAAQAQALAAFRAELAGEVQALLQQLEGERQAMGQAQRQELAGVRPALRADVLALRRGFYDDVGHVVAETTAVSQPNQPEPEPEIVEAAEPLETDEEEFSDDFADLFTDDFFAPIPPNKPDKPAIPALIDLHGIGPKTEHLLNKVGITTVPALAQAEAEQLHVALDQTIPLSKIEEWIAVANTAVGGDI